MVTRRPRHNPGKNLWEIGEDVAETPRPARGKAKPDTVEGTPVSPVRLYWPNGRMRPMPGDIVYTMGQSFITGSASVRGVAVKRGASVRIMALGKSHPASARWTVENDPVVDADIARRRAEKSRAESEARQSAQDARDAASRHARSRGLRPVESFDDFGVGDALYRVYSPGEIQFGTLAVGGDARRIVVESVVVGEVIRDMGTFVYEDDEGRERTGGKITNWWRVA